MAITISSQFIFQSVSVFIIAYISEILHQQTSQRNLQIPSTSVHGLISVFVFSKRASPQMKNSKEPSNLLSSLLWMQESYTDLIYTDRSRMAITFRKIIWIFLQQKLLNCTPTMQKHLCYWHWVLGEYFTCFKVETIQHFLQEIFLLKNLLYKMYIATAI